MRNYITITIDQGEHSTAVYPIDTAEQIAEAQAELASLGIASARIWAGDPDCPDSYETGGVLWAFSRELGCEMTTPRNPFPALEEGPVPADARLIRRWSWLPCQQGLAVTGEVWSPKHGLWIGCTTSAVVARRLTETGEVAVRTLTGSWYAISERS
jgi:hypothetical protein